MSAKIIDGKQISSEIKDELKERTKALKEQTGRVPTLAVVLAGDDPASQVYVKNKQAACAYCGMESVAKLFPENVSAKELTDCIDALNADDNVNGILVQLPLPAGLPEQEITCRVSPEKDVDCFHPVNAGALMRGEDGFAACTPSGVIELLKRTGVGIAGKRCVVVGRSNIVGKPMALLMLRENATVTVAHSKTRDLSETTRSADILIVAAGKRHLIGEGDVKSGAVVIDVGVHRDLETKKLSGDVDFDAVKEIAGAITPVPGGVGPMTIAMLLKNCVLAFERQNGLTEKRSETA